MPQKQEDHSKTACGSKQPEGKDCVPRLGQVNRNSIVQGLQFSIPGQKDGNADIREVCRW